MLTDIYTLLSGVFFYFCFLIIFLRFLLQLIGADFYNPVSQFAVKATDPVLGPLRKVIPSAKNIDFAAIVVLILLKVAEYSLYQIIYFGEINSVFAMFAVSLNSLVSMVIRFFLYAVIAQIVLSWIAPQNYNPIVALLFQITEPLMAPARKIVPAMGGIDFSPILVILGLQILEIILVSDKGILPLVFSLIGGLF